VPFVAFRLFDCGRCSAAGMLCIHIGFKVKEVRARTDLEQKEFPRDSILPELA
jgi:hypothetical protein